MKQEIFHATTVAKDGRALLIRGASGSGKSALALQMMALGAELVADDRTALRAEDDGLVPSPAPTIAGRIEARHIGLLCAPQAGASTLIAAVDMDQIETDRLPPARNVTLLGRDVPLFHRATGPHFAATMYLLLTGATLTR